MLSLPIIQNECRECFACCLHVGVPPYENKVKRVYEERYPGVKYNKPPPIDRTHVSEYAKQSRSLRAEIDAEVRTKGYVVGEANGSPCMMLDMSNPASCTIYKDRPNDCRRFEYASDECFEARKQAGLTPLDPRDR